MGIFLRSKDIILYNFLSFKITFSFWNKCNFLSIIPALTFPKCFLFFHFFSTTFWIYIFLSSNFIFIPVFLSLSSNSLNFFITIFTNPSARVGYDTRSVFKWSFTGLNSEFSFSYTSCLTKAEEPSLPYWMENNWIHTFPKGISAM